MKKYFFLVFLFLYQKSYAIPFDAIMRPALTGALSGAMRFRLLQAVPPILNLYKKKVHTQINNYLGMNKQHQLESLPPHIQTFIHHLENEPDGIRSFLYNPEVRQWAYETFKDVHFQTIEKQGSLTLALCTILPHDIWKAWKDKKLLQAYIEQNSLR